MTPAPGPECDEQNALLGGADRRRALIVAAETRRLQRQLLVCGPMHRDRLKYICGADRWREGTFEEAVMVGRRTGVLRQLPMGWLAAERHPSA